MKVDVEFIDYSNVKIETENSILMELRNYFTFDVDGARFSPKYKWGAWDGKIRLLTNDGLLPFGLVNILEKYCNENEIDIEIDKQIRPVEQFTRENFDEWINKLEIYSGENRIYPHWYQSDSVFTAINSNRRILNLPTSSGKSNIACLISRWYLENYEGKILILVPTTALVDQMINDFDDYRLIPKHLTHGIISGSKKYTNKPVIVSTWQSACKMDREWFSQFGMVIVDECHTSTSKEVSTIVKNVSHCQFKFGMSGSLRDGKSNILQYIGMFGDIFRPVTTSGLMEEGAVSNLDINTVFLRYPDEESVLHKGKVYQDEIKVIQQNTKRNAWVCRLALKLAQVKNENVLLLFKNTAHGKLLFKALQTKYGDKVHYVSGETKTDVRTELKYNTENEDGVIIVASYGVFSTGISIKKLHHVIFAHPIKSKILVLQSIGRVLRKHDSKTVAKLWDIIDDFCVKPKSSNAKKKYAHMNYAYKHGLERIQRYNDEKFNYTIKEIIL